VLEIIISKYLHEAMEKRWNPFQHGNRKEHSQMSQLVCVHEHMLLRAYKYGRVDCVRLDFTRAADMVVHSILVEKLRQLCIDPVVVNWIRAFLRNRVQSVKVGNALSNPLPVTSGLPQGSPLSNVLLMIYLNDLTAELNNENIYQYSDDTLITRIITEEEDCVKLQRDLKTLERWMDYHGMKINLKKCHVLSFSLNGYTPSYTATFPYELRGEKIEHLRSMKYLGIMMSYDFFWDEHIDYLDSKFKQDFTNQMWFLRHYSDSFQTEYFSRFLRVRLEKCSAAWNPPFNRMNAPIIEKMENLQDSLLQFTRFKHQLPSLAERRLNQLMILFFKILQKPKSYHGIAAMIDICDRNFSWAIFKAFIKLPESILGTAIKEYVRLGHFISDNCEENNIVYTKEGEFYRANPFMLKFCSDRNYDFVKNGDDKMDIDPVDALFLVSKNLHPSYSDGKIRDKIKRIRASASTSIPTCVINLIRVQLDEDEENAND